MEMPTQIVSASYLSKIQLHRAGVILYCVIEGKVYFLFARDRRTYDLCDFGGHRDDHDPNALATALREFREESGGIFAQHKVSLRQIALYDDNMAILFLPIATDRYASVIKKFQHNIEVTALCWIDEKQLQTLVYHSNGQHEHLWSLTAKFLRGSVAHLCMLLKQLYIV